MRKGFYKKKDKKLQNFTAKKILAHIKNLNNNKIMEFIKKEEIKILSNPGVESLQLLNSKNSTSNRVTITKVTVQPGFEQPRHKHEKSEQIWIALSGNGKLLLKDCEKNFSSGDVVRFEDGDIHGLKNDSHDVFEYISVTSPPIDFSYAYKEESGEHNVR